MPERCLGDIRKWFVKTYRQLSSRLMSDAVEEADNYPCYSTSTYILIEIYSGQLAFDSQANHSTNLRHSAAID